MENNYYLYFLLCKNEAIYIGITNDIEKRIKKHSVGKGAKYTKIFGVKEILFAIKIGEKSLAMSVERFVKNKDRNYKLDLIKNTSILKKDYKFKTNKILFFKKVSNRSIEKINKSINNF